MRPTTRNRILYAFVAGVVLACCAAWWSYAHLTTLVQAQLASLLGSDLTVERVTARWNRVELAGVRIPRPGAGPHTTRFSVSRVDIRPSLSSLFHGRLDIREITLEKPYLLLEILPDGKFARIFPRRAPRPGGGAPLPVKIGSLQVVGGRVELLDRHIGRTGRVGLSDRRERLHLVGFHDISIAAGPLDLPLSTRPMPLDVRIRSGAGSLSMAGALAPQGLQGHLELRLSDLDITRFRPYYIKEGDLNVSAGTLSGTCSLKIDKRHLHAPGVLQLKGLAFDRSSARGVLLGIPAWALVSFLSDNRDILSLPFTVSGSLDNPRFSVQQSLVEQIAVSLSSKIGVPTLGGIGRGVLGIFGISGDKR